MTFADAWQHATPDDRYDLDERAAILEYEAGLPRAEAEQRAVEMVGSGDGNRTRRSRVMSPAGPPGPSPQSMSQRSPPRATRVAAVPRAAVGTEAAVPMKVTYRSTPRS